MPANWHRMLDCTQGVNSRYWGIWELWCEKDLILWHSSWYCIVGNFRKRKLSCSSWYRIAGNFRGGKLSGIGHFCSVKVPRPQTLRRKLLRIAIKPQNSWTFSPSKVSYYTVIRTRNTSGVHSGSGSVIRRWKQRHVLMTLSGCKRLDRQHFVYSPVYTY